MFDGECLARWREGRDGEKWGLLRRSRAGSGGRGNLRLRVSPWAEPVDHGSRWNAKFARDHGWTDTRERGRAAVLLCLSVFGQVFLRLKTETDDEMGASHRAGPHRQLHTKTGKAHTPSQELPRHRLAGGIWGSSSRRR